MRVYWPSVNVYVDWSIVIPELDVNKGTYAKFEDGREEHNGDALCSGYALILCQRTTSEDGVAIEIASFDGTPKVPYPYSIDSIRATTWDALYSKYTMLISAVGLLIVALEVVASLGRWLWGLFILDP